VGRLAVPLPDRLSFLVVYINNRTRHLGAAGRLHFGRVIDRPCDGLGRRRYGSLLRLGLPLCSCVAVLHRVLPFDEKNWWAIIPAGVLTVLAIIAGAAIAGWIQDGDEGVFANAFLMGGLAATFAVVWLRHDKPWAKVVTIVLAGLGVASVFFASYTEIFWPVAIILVGVYLLYTAMRPRTA
jgi:hypothetical protein